jgi:hypothetical protein
MPLDPSTGIAAVGVIGGLLAGAVALFNSRKAVRWKRAELANNYMKDFNSSDELVFAGRCLDWNGGKLILPESLRPYAGGAEIIDHDRRIFARALRPDLQLDEMNDDPRIQIYRTTMDSFLSWLSLVSSAIDRKLFLAADIQDVGYWVAKIESEVVLHSFIIAYGYGDSIQRLVRIFRGKKSAYQKWVFPINDIGLTSNEAMQRTAPRSDA